MRYVFFGTTDFSEMVLAGLGKSLPPALVVCNPDRPVGRKKIVTSPAIKIASEAAGIPLSQPEKLDAEFVSRIRSGNFDLAVLASYGKILPATLLSATRLGTIGVHVSLLPKFRGASPMQSAILAGEELTGVTLYLMDEKVDHGPILDKAELPLRDQDFPTLQAQSAALAADLLTRVLPEFLAGRIVPSPQTESEATYTRKFTTQDAFVEPADLAKALQGDAEAVRRTDRMIRAFHPEPGAWTVLDGKRTKLLAASIEKGRLVLRRIQTEGGLPRSV